MPKLNQIARNDGWRSSFSSEFCLFAEESRNSYSYFPNLYG